MSSHYVNQGPSAEHASLFPCLMRHIQSELMKTPRVEWVLLALPRRRVVKEIESNGGTAILSLPYGLFINLTIRSDACLLLESVHTHSNLTSTYQLATICFSAQGWLTTNTFSFWHYIIQHKKYTLSLKMSSRGCKWKSLKFWPTWIRCSKSVIYERR